jgi:hypothetical protein
MKQTFVARSLRSRRDKADDEDLSCNVGRQARCEPERQARADTSLAEQKFDLRCSDDQHSILLLTWIQKLHISYYQLRNHHLYVLAIDSTNQWPRILAI